MAISDNETEGAVQRFAPPVGPPLIVALTQAHDAAEGALSALSNLIQDVPRLTPLDPEKGRQISMTPEIARAVMTKLSEIQRAADQLQGVHRKAADAYDKICAHMKIYAERDAGLEERRRQIEAEEKALQALQQALAWEKSRQIEAQRDLAMREARARSQFAEENAGALRALEQEIAHLEARKIRLLEEIAATRTQHAEEDSQRVADLIRRENDAASETRRIARERERLDSEWRDLEEDRKRIERDARDEADQRVQRMLTQRQKDRDRLIQRHNDVNELKERLEQYQDFAVALEGRSAQDAMDELERKNRRVLELEGRLANRADEKLAAENEALQRVCAARLAQIEGMTAEWEADKIQLLQLRLSVDAKIDREAEARLLRVEKDALLVKLSDLEKLVSDLTRASRRL